MSILNLEAFRAAPLVSTPFDYLAVPNFVRSEALVRIRHDFPSIQRSGSFPLTSLEYGPSFAELTDELRGAEVRQAFCDKFGLDLTDRPTTLTVRGRTRLKDGRIHTDSKTKLITVLLYLNSGWQSDGGRLRLLGSPHDMEDTICEVPPEDGMLVAFRNGKNAWHGHKPFEGERRSLQLNWVADARAVRRSSRRHGLSALIKRLNPIPQAAWSISRFRIRENTFTHRLTPVARPQEQS